MFPLLLSTLAFAQDEAEETRVTFDIEGHYRVRLHHFNGLYDPASWDHEPGTGRYMSQRLRLHPSANFDDRAKRLGNIACVRPPGPLRFRKKPGTKPWVSGPVAT